MALLLLLVAAGLARSAGSDVSVTWVTGRAALPCVVPDSMQTRKPRPPLESSGDHTVTQLRFNTTYQWRKDDELFTTRKTSANGTLEVPRNRETSPGVYQCAVNTHAGTVLGYPVHLKYAYLDRRFKSPPKDATVQVGQPVVLNCGIGSGPPATITWKKNGVVLQNDTRIWMLQSKLYIFDARADDAGNFSCTARNPYLEKTRTSSAATLSISEQTEDLPSSFLLEEVHTVIKAWIGETVVMPCPIAGYPKPEVLWVFHSLAIERDMELDSTDQILVRSDMSAEQEGVYACRIAGQNGVERTFNLVLKEKTKLIHRPEPKEQTRASTVRFRCSATGKPMPTITWYKNGNPITIGGRVRHLKSTQDDVLELVISSVASEDAGVYQCFASTGEDGGMVSAWAPLSVSGEGGAVPTDLRCKAVGPLKVRLSWDHPDPRQVMAYTVLTTPTDKGTSLIGQPYTERHTEIIVDRSLTMYSFQIRAYAKPTSTFSNVASDFTAPVQCQGQGAPVLMYKLDNGQILVSWQEFAARVPDVKEWMLLVRPVNTSDVTNHTLSGSTTNYTLTVPDGKVLEVQVLGSRSQDWIEEDLSGLPWTNTTQTDVERKTGMPPPVPSSIEVTRVSAHSADLHWAGTDDLSDSYILCVSRPSRVKMENTSCQESNEPYAVIGGLTANTNYEIRIQARGREPSAFSKPINITTLLEDLTYTYVNETAVQVSWLINPSYHGDYYTVRYSSKLKLPVDIWNTLEVTENTALLTGLDPLEKTYVMVTSYKPTEHSRIYTIPQRDKVIDVSTLSWQHSGSSLQLTWPAGTAVPGCMLRYAQNITQPIELWPQLNFSSNSVVLPGVDNSRATFVSVLCYGASHILTVPQDSPPRTSLYLGVGLACGICGLLLLLALVVLCLSRKRKRANSPSRSRRRDTSGHDGNEEVDSELKNVGGRLANGRGAGQPLLNGHVHITENPTLSKTPNGRLKRPRHYEDAFDLSRNDEADVTMQTFLDADTSATSCYLLDTSRRPEDATEDISVPPHTNSSYNKLPDDNMNSEIPRSTGFKERDISKVHPTLQPNG